ncbi:MAG TPA: cysteine hydrolase family protein [Xanthobacteraceae bacterium]|nr:cysteine hydrolase family protein [Xanthobacteraceae bacterium]
MSYPKTLLQMAGAPLEPSRFTESAVIIIDAQNEYVNGKLPLVGIAPALDNIAILLKAARAAGAPVIHVQHKGRAGGLFDPGADAFKLAPQAASEAGEIIVEKPLPNAFAQTSLQDEVVKSGRKQLIVAGFQTHMCISSTVRAALDLGYRTTVVADAAATRDLPDPTGGPAFAAADLHRAALAGLADRFAIVAKLADLKA